MYSTFLGFFTTLLFCRHEYASATVKCDGVVSVAIRDKAGGVAVDVGGYGVRVYLEGNIIAFWI